MGRDKKLSRKPRKPEKPVKPVEKGYIVKNLVTNELDSAAFVDPKLVNPWGLARGPTTPWWVANAGSGYATVYNGTGQPQPRVVKIPPPDGSPLGAFGRPTGIVFNTTTSFPIRSGGLLVPSIFLFATENGTIAGWNPSVNATDAVTLVDNSKFGAIYKGLALVCNRNGNFLLVTNFRSGYVEIYDGQFKLVKRITDKKLYNRVDPPIKEEDAAEAKKEDVAANADKDAKNKDENDEEDEEDDAKGKPPCPRPPPPRPPVKRCKDAQYAPFGIQTIDGLVYVTFALQNEEREDALFGPGHGFVDFLKADQIGRQKKRGRKNDKPSGKPCKPKKPAGKPKKLAGKSKKPSRSRSRSGSSSGSRSRSNSRSGSSSSSRSNSRSGSSSSSRSNSRSGSSSSSRSNSRSGSGSESRSRLRSRARPCRYRKLRLRRLISRGYLNAPWGIALAPKNFGVASRALLIGNFGDGSINAFTRRGEWLGHLNDCNCNSIVIDGLWGLAFGAGDSSSSGPSNALFFTAGPNHEADGLFGVITRNILVKPIA